MWFICMKACGSLCKKKRKEKQRCSPSFVRALHLVLEPKLQKKELSNNIKNVVVLLTASRSAKLVKTKTNVIK